MINFGALSILLIHRELLADAKRLINTVHDGISSLFPIRKTFKQYLKESGDIKGVNNRMSKHSNRSLVWRLSGKSFNVNINSQEGSQS